MDILRQLPRDLQVEILTIHKQNYEASFTYVVEAEFNVRVRNWSNDGLDWTSSTSLVQYPFMQVMFDSGTGTWHSPGRLARVDFPSNRTNYIYVGYNEISPRKVKGLMHRAMQTPYYKSLLANLNNRKDVCTTYFMTIRMLKIVKENPVYKDPNGWYMFDTIWHWCCSIDPENASGMWGRLRSCMERRAPLDTI